jgi:hypothetical protein
MGYAPKGTGIRFTGQFGNVLELVVTCPEMMPLWSFHLLSSSYSFACPQNSLKPHSDVKDLVSVPASGNRDMTSRTRRARTEG